MPKNVLDFPPPMDMKQTIPVVPKVEMSFDIPTKVNTGERIVLYATEGWGKTTLAASAEGAGIIMCGSETGYLTLLRHKRVPERHVCVATRWEQVLSAVKAVADSKLTVVAIDTIGGAERMCHEHVCDTQFDGDWGERGFSGFQRGYNMSMAEWLKLLSALDAVAASGTHVLMLGHTVVKPHNDPLEPSYDKYKCAVHEKTWNATNQWADDVLFGKFLSDVQREKGELKAKGKGDNSVRVLYTKGCDAYDAKNRCGMPSMLRIPDKPEESFNVIGQYI